MPHRISPSLVVSFEEREQSADLLQNLRPEKKMFSKCPHLDYSEGAMQMASGLKWNNMQNLFSYSSQKKSHPRFLV